MLRGIEVPNPFTAGAVVYAKDIAKVSAFYAGVTDLAVTHSAQDHIVLESTRLQLVVVAIPARLAATIHVTVPPRRREDTAIKLVLSVGSMAEARAAAALLGGQVDPPEREWAFQGSRVCDGHDPEGNVVQFRANPR